VIAKKTRNGVQMHSTPRQLGNRTLRATNGWPMQLVSTIVMEIGVEGIVPRPGNTDPVPETRGHFRPRLVKISHKDRILFLNPIDPESL